MSLQGLLDGGGYAGLSASTEVRPQGDGGWHPSTIRVRIRMVGKSVFGTEGPQVNLSKGSPVQAQERESLEEF